jgi:hypothetical protein
VYQNAVIGNRPRVFDHVSVIPRRAVLSQESRDFLVSVAGPRLGNLRTG